MKIKTACMWIVLPLFLMGCSSLPLASQLFKASPESTAVGILFQDDFSETSSGWDRMISEVGSTDYDHEAYHIIVNEPITDLFANPYTSFKDVIIEVNAARVSGPLDNSFGVICRYRDEENFYAALISSDGYAGIFEVSDGKYHLMGHDEMIPVPAILGGKAANLIHFECIGNSLALAVNNEPVDAQSDKSYESGDVGLIAGTFLDPGVHVVFDDFIVRQP
ncbi:MAG: hypothetical protein PWQ55_1276 [Chloroflexota bacterium]|nr:hypothetical protein [Chloroflexota bacterium]